MAGIRVRKFARYAVYAVSLSLIESIISAFLATAIVLLTSRGAITAGDVRDTVAFVGAFHLVATGVRLLMNVPVVIIALFTIAPRLPFSPKVSAAVTNVFVYICGLTAVIAIEGNLSNLPRIFPIYSTFAISCAFSPFVSWIQPPFASGAPRAAASR